MRILYIPFEIDEAKGVPARAPSYTHTNTTVPRRVPIHLRVALCAFSVLAPGPGSRRRRWLSRPAGRSQSTVVVVAAAAALLSPRTRTRWKRPLLLPLLLATGSGYA